MGHGFGCGDGSVKTGITGMLCVYVLLSILSFLVYGAFVARVANIWSSQFSLGPDTGLFVFAAQNVKPSRLLFTL